MRFGSRAKRREVESTAPSSEQMRRDALDAALTEYERRGFQIESRTTTQAVVVRWPRLSRFPIRLPGTRLVIWADQHAQVETRKIEARRW